MRFAPYAVSGQRLLSGGGGTVTFLKAWQK